MLRTSTVQKLVAHPDRRLLQCSPRVSPSRTSARNFLTTVDQSETGLLFRFGEYVGTKEPGLRVSIPIINEVRKVDMRVHTLSIPPQELITRDNVTIHVDAVCFFRVVDPGKAILAVDDYRNAVNEAAQSSLRAQLSRATFSEALHDREEAGKVVLQALCRITEQWGVKADLVQLKNISIDQSMVRAMSRKAEAERIREARLIEADAEVRTAEKLAEAATYFDESPFAMRLRELQTYAQIAAEGNTVLIPANLSSSVATSMALWPKGSSRSGTQTQEHVEGISKRAQKLTSTKEAERVKREAEEDEQDEEDGVEEDQGAKDEGKRVKET
ncbi:hypothetical protein PENSPDRAFT_682863 [Peniophora sp. CONT]|nr:hypothetical protein PENSPDRAFT_682863 [Peniophora sp. CONT]